MKFKNYYIYGMKARPFSIGCQPMEGLMASDAFNFLKIDIDEVNMKFHDTLLYDRKLTEKELYDYELEFIGTHREFDTPQWLT